MIGTETIAASIELPPVERNVFGDEGLDGKGVAGMMEMSDMEIGESVTV